MSLHYNDQIRSLQGQKFEETGRQGRCTKPSALSGHSKRKYRYIFHAQKGLFTKLEDDNSILGQASSGSNTLF